MEQAWNDFKKAVQEAEKRGAVLHPVKRNNSELDMAVERYKTEQEKAQRMARLFG